VSAIVNSTAIASPSKANNRGIGRGWLKTTGYNLVGFALLMAAWWFGGWLIASSDDLFAFADFAPAPAIARLIEMVVSGEALAMILPSLYRVGLGLFWAIVIGVPVGVLIGCYASLRAVTNMPFPFLPLFTPPSCIPTSVIPSETCYGATVSLFSFPPLSAAACPSAAGHTAWPHPTH